jgi:hypothetical protein
MYYYLFTSIILLFFFLELIILFKNLVKYGNFYSTIFYPIIISIFLTITFKISFINYFFGYEYEDAFIYNIAAKQFYKNIYPISFLTDGIFWGSLVKPMAMATYSSHFITYSVFISWFYYIFGYNINIPSFLNSFIEFLTIFFLSISAKYIFNIKKYWIVFPIVYCLSPAMNLFGTSQLSETFSSFVILSQPIYLVSILPI